jgi:CRISPR-associated protein Cmr3
MTTTLIEIACRDPIVARDSRPFGASSGNRMKSVSWLLPSVIAGSLRTLIGKRAGRDFTGDVVKQLLEVEVSGAFPVVGETLYLPAPYDCVSGALRASPQPTSCGDCNMPECGLMPVMLAEGQAKVDFKPGKPPVWWPLDRYLDWLTAKAVVFDCRFLGPSTAELRTHVQLLPETGAAEKSRLFTTSALPLSHLPRYGVSERSGLSERLAPIKLSTRATARGWAGEALGKLDSLHTLGGERRLAHWAARAGESWDCPSAIKSAIAGQGRIRMILASPAIFTHGWRPGWLDSGLSGSPPGCATVLKLVGACIPRWRAVSGWSLAEPRGPKASRRMVPAGGVYYFTVPDRSSDHLESLWLRSVSDLEQDRLDGFGLSVWGIW